MEDTSYQYKPILTQIIFHLTAYVAGTIGNFLVIFVVILNRELQTTINIYLLNLALTDLIFLQSIPFAVITLIKQNWVFNSFICKTYWIFTGINSYTSVFLISVLAFDR